MNVQKTHQPSTLWSHDSVYFECNHKGVAQTLANHFLWEIQKNTECILMGHIVVTWSSTFCMFSQLTELENCKYIVQCILKELSMFWFRKVLVFWTWNHHVLSKYWLSTGGFVPSDCHMQWVTTWCQIGKVSGLSCRSIFHLSLLASCPRHTQHRRRNVSKPPRAYR